MVHIWEHQLSSRQCSIIFIYSINISCHPFHASATSTASASTVIHFMYHQQQHRPQCILWHQEPDQAGETGPRVVYYIYMGLLAFALQVQPITNRGRRKLYGKSPINRASMIANVPVRKYWQTHTYTLTFIVDACVYYLRAMLPCKHAVFVHVVCILDSTVIQTQKILKVYEEAWELQTTAVKFNGSSANSIPKAKSNS